VCRKKDKGGGWGGGGCIEIMNAFEMGTGDTCISVRRSHYPVIREKKEVPTINL